MSNEEDIKKIFEQIENISKHLSFLERYKMVKKFDYYVNTLFSTGFILIFLIAILIKVSE